MHATMKPLFLFSITFFLGISSFLYTTQARPLPDGFIAEVGCKDFMVMKSYLRPSYSPPPPPSGSSPSPELRSPPTTVSRLKPSRSTHVSSS